MRTGALGSTGARRPEGRTEADGAGARACALMRPTALPNVVARARNEQHLSVRLEGRRLEARVAQARHRGGVAMLCRGVNVTEVARALLQGIVQTQPSDAKDALDNGRRAVVGGAVGAPSGRLRAPPVGEGLTLSGGRAVRCGRPAGMRRRAAPPA